ncbi:hypothetical protein SLEP1_g47430 [Rubroshorea leprosula]|uniref:Uncharacterized protein n=1 Tax=Rubroshorea leprosula TaxID=152421 RepID=A0AAV5LS70_9ROSI|nr:hypothetical protein SLEP1_g47430 [Rubroshorea leprosula]
MEGVTDGNGVPPNAFDKSKILDVKPLRSLAPVFPDGPQGQYFVCAPPFGPFPSGFTPFYPFSVPPGFQSEPETPTPIRLFRTAVPHFSATRNGESGASMDASRGGSGKPPRKNRDVQFSSGKGPAKDFKLGFSSTERDDGNWEVVENVLMRFDALRRRFSQLEDAKETTSGIIRRADLKAGNVLMSKGIRTNMKKRIGAVPGIQYGEIFFFRMELCVVGLHAPSMGGIDYINVRGNSEQETLALSIVSSGGYDDEAEDADVLIYSGQGGNAYYKDKEAADQKLERGNLALETSLHRGNEVRVVRGMKDAVSTKAKVYVYDGLYKIQESWMEKGKSGGSMFKYKLLRLPGQPDVFALWKSIEKWKEGLSSRPGLILPDLASGAESMPVSLVNEVDDEKGPAYFTYFPTVKYSKSFKLLHPSFGCNCHSACAPGSTNCSCIQKNGGDFPYTANFNLVSRKSLVYECGPSCPCFPNCKNRVSQMGLKVRLEIFKTRDRGWGLRSWDPIRAGTFICEYAGEVIDKINTRQSGEDDHNEHVFDTSRTYQSFRWNFEPELIEEESPPAPTEEFDIPSPLIISAKNIGNVARFMNHSCSPNVFWQPVIYEHNNESFLHIAFFAKRHIPPMTELTYDYGIAPTDGESNSTPSGRKKCLCGSPQCRGYY